MKLSKASWLFLIGGILLILFASLGIAGAKQLRDQEQLYDDLTVAERRVEKLQLEQLNLQQEQLAGQINQAAAELSAARDRLKHPNESIDVTDFLFEIADSCSVDILDVNSRGLSSGDLGDIACSVQSITTSVEGNLPDLISFVTRLNTDFTTGVVDSADISIPEADEEARPTAHVQLSIYTYQGE